MATLFTGAVIGMYFQPPSLRVFFNATGLEPGAGTNTPIAVAIQQVIKGFSQNQTTKGATTPFTPQRSKPIPFPILVVGINWLRRGRAFLFSKNAQPRAAKKVIATPLHAPHDPTSLG
ncbi:hypothetical protein [Sulfitobacter sp.]|uniref:hypothetical protein n=1 Tax=Sulfitobacter sp. TaxID=1903071 RepID=UPI00300347D1